MWTLIYDVLDEKGVPTHRRSVEAFSTPYRAASFVETDLNPTRSRPVAILPTSSVMVDLVLNTRETPR